MNGMDGQAGDGPEEIRENIPPNEQQNPINGNGIAGNGAIVGYAMDPPMLANGYHMAPHFPHIHPPRFYGAPPLPPPAHILQHALLHFPHPIMAHGLHPMMPHLLPQPADSLITLLQRYPVLWQGMLSLKNNFSSVQMHFICGNIAVANEALPFDPDGATPHLKICQRMPLDSTQIEGILSKMQSEAQHCMLLALPCGRDHIEVVQQSENLDKGFITYMDSKNAAGVANIAVEGTGEPAYVVHVFAPCDFAHENVEKTAPDLLDRVTDLSYLIVIITTV